LRKWRRQFSQSRSAQLPISTGGGGSSSSSWRARSSRSFATTYKAGEHLWLVRFSLHLEFYKFTEGHWSHTYVSIGHINQNGLSYLSLLSPMVTRALIGRVGTGTRTAGVNITELIRKQGWILTLYKFFF